MKYRQPPTSHRSVRLINAGATLPVQLELFAATDATCNLGTPSPHAGEIENGGPS